MTGTRQLITYSIGRWIFSAIRRTVVVVWTIFVLAVLFLLVWWFIPPTPDIVHAVSLPGTPWSIEDRIIGFQCTICGGDEEIAAKNKTTGKEVRLIVFKYPVHTEITIGKSNQVIISFPATADIAEQHDSFDGIPVVYNFK